MGYSTVTSFVAVQFLYRYWIMMSDWKTKLFDGWRIIFSLIYSFGCGAVYGSAIYWLYPMDEEQKQYLRKEMFENYNASIENIPGFVVVGYETENNQQARKEGMKCISILLTVMVVQYSIMVYSGIQMHLKLKCQIRSLSIPDKHLQKQLLKALIIQITSPSLLCCIPLVPILAGPFFFKNISFPSGIFVTPFTIFPSLDSLILMIVVTEYRDYISSIWRKRSLEITYTHSVSWGGLTN
ncbi:unnamed protein product [Caenorhabditis angaria]|uniref:Seven TM Receptor n=1 Tax=Caenorhabditis angaria TaxID=860376 RepID=A0A9P1IWE6_9PELO|nr:unnamed protein product [Caenorhabditis angaria]